MNILNKEELRRQIREGKEISLDGIFSQRVQAQEIPKIDSNTNLYQKSNRIIKCKYKKKNKF